ncbi:MAG: ATP-binding protein [Verrucomicrobia bacterium]|nr:ATP-binding protein [Verrucomicrobiota bacterium]
MQKRPDDPTSQAPARRAVAATMFRGDVALAADASGTMSPEAMRVSLHNLQARQIELERQNEELRRTRAEIATAWERYFDLFEQEYRRQDGAVIPVELRTLLLCGAVGQPLTRWESVRDLIERKQADDKLLTLRTELEHAQRLALVSEVSAGIIHQICQPLCAIGANLSSVTARLKACDSKTCGSLAMIKDIEADVVRMREIVIHLRELINPGQPTRTRVDFNSVVTGVLPLLAQKAERHRVRFAVELGQNLPQVEVDAVQVCQIILNLVRNALEACEDCPLERREVVLTTRELAGEGVELCVRDAGTGLDQETLARLFTPFFSTKPDGFGIGLRFSRTVAEAHGGTLAGYNNADGVGATFRVVLPVNHAPHSSNERPEPPPCQLMPTPTFPSNV